MAPAKINLGLEIIRRREDGYHDINTVFAAIALCDEITLRLRDDQEITCVVEGNDQLREESPENNLCVKAVRSVCEHLGEDRGVDIHLQKNIPTGAGLGGGSSDGGAVLRGILKLLGREEEEAILPEIAASLGSDVPFFLRGGVALGTSRGEILYTLDLELPWHCLIINPGIHIPTPWAYREVDRRMEREATDLEMELRKGMKDPLGMRRHFVNDFEPPVFATYPEIGEIKERLYHHGTLFALMSGSGSTVFGLFETKEKAEEAAEGFNQYWHRITRFHRQ